MTKHFRPGPNGVQVLSPAGGLAPVPANRRRRGRRNYLSGLSAERAVAAEYDRRGADLIETRWRGQGGEIDLIFLHRGVYVFCEVKKARSFDEAAMRLCPAQARRIHVAASEYLGHTPAGQLSQVRFDLALADDAGRIEIREGAFSHF